MTRLWWAQVKAVIRLELKKTFFARRGLWIYAVAALPVLLFIAYAVAMSNEQHKTAKIARGGAKPADSTPISPPAGRPDRTRVTNAPAGLTA